MEYKAAGKAWLESVVKDKEEAYIKLFDKLMELGNPYIDNLDQADREQVFKCIRDKTGRFLDNDDFMMYVETQEEKERPKYVFTCDAKLALTDYYDAVHTLCEAQQNFARSTQVLEKKIEDKSVFLDIIQQVQLPSVQVQVRTVEEMEQIEGKTYRELTLMLHLPNFKRIYPIPQNKPERWPHTSTSSSTNRSPAQGHHRQVVPPISDVRQHRSRDW